MKMIITKGLPASGKTYWAEQFVKDSNGQFINVNRDDLRVSLFGSPYKFSKRKEAAVSSVQWVMINTAFDDGFSVVVSDTNLNPKVMSNLMGLAKENLADVEIKSFLDVPLGAILKRDQERDDRVGEKVIIGMFERYKDQFDTYTPNLDNKPAYIFDIDGTLALMDGRRPYDWDKVNSDLPNQSVVQILKSLSTRYDIVILSGRDGVCKEKTEKWLNRHGIVHDGFFMREANDNRADYIIKRELFENHVADTWNIQGVFDDRDQVVHLWRSMGIPCYQVAYGAF